MNESVELIKTLRDRIDILEKIIANRGKFMDWAAEVHPEIIQEYLGEKEK